MASSRNANAGYLSRDACFLWLLGRVLNGFTNYDLSLRRAEVRHLFCALLFPERYDSLVSVSQVQLVYGVVLGVIQGGLRRTVSI